MRKMVFALLIALILLASCGPIQSANCPISTQSDPAFIPPEPAPRQAPYETMFWHGEHQLWTMIPKRGVWQALPFTDAGYTQKTFWWSPGYEAYDDPSPQFKVVARRLDGTQDQIEFIEATNAYSGEIGSAILVGITLPEAGCWEITGSYRGQQLSFTVLLSP